MQVGGIVEYAIILHRIWKDQITSWLFPSSTVSCKTPIDE